MTSSVGAGGHSTYDPYEGLASMESISQRLIAAEAKYARELAKANPVNK